MNFRQGDGDDPRKGSAPIRLPPAPPPVLSPRDRLLYVADMLRQLRTMAMEADCGDLTSLIERAYREAARQTRLGPS